MKPVSLANSPQNVDQVGTARFEKDRVLQRAVDEDYFTVPLGPGYCTYEDAAGAPAAAAGFEVKNADAFVMQLPAGVVTRINRQVPTRELWARTRPRMKIWYTSPVGAVAAFNFRFVLRLFVAGGTTTNALVTVDWTAPGPAAAGGVLYTTCAGAIVFPSLPGVVLCRLVRLGPDANANPLDVIQAAVTFEEVA